MENLPLYYLAKGLPLWIYILYSKKRGWF